MPVLERKVPKVPDWEDVSTSEALKAEARAIVQQELGFAATAALGLLLVIGFVADLGGPAES